MKCNRSILIIAVFLSFSVPYANAGKTVQIKLMLGGKFCGEYTVDVENALKDMTGVKHYKVNHSKLVALYPVSTKWTK